jgi:predicted N-acyltransferase
VRFEVHDTIGDIEAADWNRLAGSDYPFLRHEFLLAAEFSGSVSPDSGWTPRHLTVRADDGELQGAMPLYEKSHSWGEFVFDWAWANAYHRAGLPYYPKLVSAVPFTPATCPKLLCGANAAVQPALVAAAIELADQSAYSSVHLLFPTDAEMQAAQAAGFQPRKDCQFHWQNAQYADFDDFLAGFSAAKRKKARRDRRRVAEAGIRFRRLSGHELDAGRWTRIHELISHTFRERGSVPYFNREFFVTWSAARPDDVLVIQAERGPEVVAAAVFFVGADTLYGRYWGSEGYHDALHFETCYYQGIEYCIAAGLSHFEPGTQGEHKISRGFTPVETRSAHWLARPEFHEAVGRYTETEAEHVEQYMRLVDEHSPFRRKGSA